jgi:hypothetical protein
MNDEKKQQQLEHQMTNFCHEFRISDKGRAVINQPIVDTARIQAIRQVLSEAAELAPQVSQQADVERLNELMEQTRRCLKTMDRQLLIGEASANIKKATEVISQQYGAQAEALLSAKKKFAQSQQPASTDLSQLDSGAATDD